MVVYIRKRLNIFVCMPSGAGAEGGGVGCMSSAVPAFMQFDDFDGDWAKLQNAVGAYNNLITDPTVVIKAEYEWARKW